LFALVCLRIVWLMFHLSPGGVGLFLGVISALFFGYALYDRRGAVLGFLGLQLLFSHLLGIFALLYLAWLAGTLARREPLAPATTLGRVIDLLLGTILVSGVLAALEQYGAGSFRLWLTSSLGQSWPPFPLEYIFQLGCGFLLLRVVLGLPQEAVRWRTWATVFVGFSLGLVLLSHVLPSRHLLLFFFNPYYKVTLLTALILAAGFLALKGPWWQRAAWVGSGLWGAVLLVQMSSRTLWVALVLGAVTALWSAGRRKVLLGVAAVFVVLVLGVNLGPEIDLARVQQRWPQWYAAVEDLKDMLTIGTHNLAFQDADSFESVLPSGIASRFALWERGVFMLAEHPLTGGGAGVFYRVSAGYARSPSARMLTIPENAHNWFLQFAADLGLPATALLGLMFWLLLRAALASRRAAPEDRLLLDGLIFGAGAFLLANTFDNMLLIPHVWLFTASMMALAVLPGLGAGSGAQAMSLALSRDRLLVLGYAGLMGLALSVRAVLLAF